MRELLRRAALAALLALPAARAGDRLRGLEMDVMLPGQTPVEAVATISLPLRAGTAALQAAADAHDSAAADSQENLEQAQKKNGAARHPAGSGPARPPVPRHQQTHPSR